jgi:hypothetical protein
MLQSYLKAARLRGWLSRPQCPPAIQECKILLDRAYRSKDASHHIDEYPLNDSARVPDTAMQTPVPEDLFRLTHQRIAVLRAHLKHERVIYSRSSTHIGNSLVLFYPKGDYNSSPVPGSIKYIYGSNGILTFAVQRQCPLLHGGQRDPFATYAHFPAKLYSSTVLDNLEIVKLSWVVSHFARWAVSDDQVIVLSLCRVSTSVLLRESPIDSSIRTEYFVDIICIPRANYA